MTTSSTTSPYPQIGHYRVVRLLGRGGMGSVFLARDMRLGRSVALKLLAHELSSATDRRQFDVEARTTASLSHPNIVTLFDIGEHEGRPWVALEYIDGCTLAQRMSEDWPTSAETLRVGLAIARAIEAAHRAGVVHRDLKPANVLLGVDGRPRVVDFGIARFVGGHSEPPPSTAEGDDLTLVGTPSYMAPEQWRGEDGPETDVWALGLILYQLLSRAHPLRGLDAAQIALRAELAEPVPSTPELHAASPELAPIVMRCLRRLPSERPTATELVTQLAALEGRLRAPTPTENPFRGLLPFSERHAHLFFGRDGEVSAFVERLRAQSILVVVGSSGAGKSSFVLAGVAPRIKESASVRVITVRPQGRPFSALAESIVRETPSSSGVSTLVDPPRFAGAREPEALADPRQLEARLLESPGLLSVVLTEIAARTGERVLLVVDQLEEICTVVHDRAEARAFLAAVCGAAGDPNEPVRVVMTVRDDFLGRLPWGANSGAALSGLVLLAPPDTDALREIVRQPLMQTGYAFDDPALLEEIVTSVRGEAACLPLLQFAMSLLWARRDETRQRLVRAVYDEIGGVGGALAAHAENVVGALDPASLELCRQLLLRLVTASGTRRAMGRAALVMGLSAGAEGLLAKLLDARLLAQQRGDDARVELAHESLTRVWRRLERWIEESHEDLAVAADLVAAAERWERLGKRDDELWQGDALRDASRLVARGSTRLPDVALSLVRDSTRRERRGALRRTVAAASLFVAAGVAVLASSMAAWALRERKNDALGAARRAEQASALLLEERALASFADGDNHAARAQLRAALEARDSVSSRNLARKLESAPLRVYLRHNTVVYDGLLLSDGRTFFAASHSGNIGVFDTFTLEQRVLRGHTDQVLGLALLPGGRLASASWNGELRAWTVGTGGGAQVARRPSFTALATFGATIAASRDRELLLVDAGDKVRTIPLEVTQPFGLAFGPDGKEVFVGGAEGKVRVVDLRTHAVARESEAGAPISRLAVDPNGRFLAKGGRDGSLTVLDLHTLRRRSEVRASGGAARALAVSKDGRVWMNGMDRRIVAWNPGTGALSAEVATHLDEVTSLSITEDQASLVATGTGGSEIWSLAAMPRERVIPPDPHPILDIAFSADGRELVSASHKRILVWSTATGRPVTEIQRHGIRSRDVALDAANHRVAAADERGGLALWELPSGRPLGTLGTTAVVPLGLVYSPRYDLAAVGTSAGAILVYALDARALRFELVDPAGSAVRALALSPDGATLYSSSIDGTLRAWDLAKRKAKVLHRVATGNYGLALSKDGQRLAATSPDGAALVLDVASSAVTPLGHFAGRLYRPAFSPDGGTVALPCSDGKVYLVDVAAKGPPRVVTGAHGEVNVAVFSADGALLATGSDDHTVRLFDATTGKPRWIAMGAATVKGPVPSEPGATAGLELPNRHIVGFDSGLVEVRHAAGGATLVLRDTPPHAVTHVVEGPSGTLALGFADGSFGVWDPGTGRALDRVLLHGHLASLTVKGGLVDAETELGDRGSLDLSILGVDYCALMSDLWRRTPFVWRSGSIRVEAPTGGRCPPPDRGR